LSITIVRALHLASRALLQSEHPDAIEARVVLLELGGVLERYERPSVVPLMRVKPALQRNPAPSVEGKPEARTTQCVWCGKVIDPGSQPQKVFCCRNHRQRAYNTRLQLREHERVPSDSDEFCDAAAG
jgi:hypothetical protein